VVLGCCVIDLPIHATIVDQIMVCPVINLHPENNGAKRLVNTGPIVIEVNDEICCL